MPFIKANDLTIFYRVFQNNQEVPAVNPTARTLIVLHGAPGLIDHQIELDAWKGFSDRVQVIFLDLRGGGQTDDLVRRVYHYALPRAICRSAERHYFLQYGGQKISRGTP